MDGLLWFFRNKLVVIIIIIIISVGAVVCADFDFFESVVIFNEWAYCQNSGFVILLLSTQVMYLFLKA